MVYDWPCCERHLKNRKVLARMANQAKLKTFRQQPKFKFGVQVPRNHAEAMKLDALHGNTKWAESEALEVSQLDEYESFKVLGYKEPAIQRTSRNPRRRTIGQSQSPKGSRSGAPKGANHGPAQTIAAVGIPVLQRCLAMLRQNRP